MAAKRGLTVERSEGVQDGLLLLVGGGANGREQPLSSGAAVGAPPGLAGDYNDDESSLLQPDRARLNLENAIATPFIGSMAHSSSKGQACNPCAFLHKDPRGCLHGYNCKFCHLCPPGEPRRRKKGKITQLRGNTGRRLRRSARAWDPKRQPGS